MRSIEEYLSDEFVKKFNTLKQCDKEPKCPCSSKEIKGGKVDLVLLIDSSGSMRTKAERINQAASIAFNNAVKECAVDVRDTWLWVDNVRPGSSEQNHLGGNVGRFTQSHQKYLEGIGGEKKYFHDRADTGESFPAEQGADAIADISLYFDWRENACRSIFYISDTTLEGVGSNRADNDKAKDQAIHMATEASVTVFSHRVDRYNNTGNMTQTECDLDYQELCKATGGRAETGGEASVPLYEKLIKEAICNCGAGCRAIKTPDLKPCISIAWGDGVFDLFEVDDFEKLVISVCNCYSNVTFNNFTIDMIEITPMDKKTSLNLPSGSSSIDVVPKGPFCFGAIEPCKDNNVTCVFREFAIRTRGAKEEKYKLKLKGIRYDVNFGYHQESCFNFTLNDS